MGLPQRLLEATDATTARDQGIDCRLTCPEDIHDDWLPPGRSCWQYKSGECPSANEVADNELVKPGVLDAIRRGDSYCFVTADDITADKAGRIQAAIDSAYTANGQPTRGRVYQAQHLARWASAQRDPRVIPKMRQGTV